MTVVAVAAVVVVVVVAMERALQHQAACLRLVRTYWSITTVLCSTIAFDDVHIMLYLLILHCSTSASYLRSTQWSKRSTHCHVVQCTYCASVLIVCVTHHVNHQGISSSNSYYRVVLLRLTDALCYCYCSGFTSRFTAATSSCQEQQQQQHHRVWASWAVAACYAAGARTGMLLHYALYALVLYGLCCCSICFIECTRCSAWSVFAEAVMA
jgi:hypothetical protein